MTWCVFWFQDLAAAIDEEDVAKFTDAVKEFDSMTPLVSVFFYLSGLDFCPTYPFHTYTQLLNTLLCFKSWVYALYEAPIVA